MQLWRAFAIFAVGTKRNTAMTHREYILQSIKDKTREIMPAEGKVILFGSQARGDYHENSDWDLLILLDKQKLASTDFDDFAYPFFELGWHLDVEIHPMLYTVGDWEKRHVLPIYHDVQKEGIVL